MLNLREKDGGKEGGRSGLEMYIKVVFIRMDSCYYGRIGRRQRGQRQFDTKPNAETKTKTAKCQVVRFPKSSSVTIAKAKVEVSSWTLSLLAEPLGPPDRSH